MEIAHLRICSRKQTQELKLPDLCNMYRERDRTERPARYRKESARRSRVSPWKRNIRVATKRGSQIFYRRGRAASTVTSCRLWKSCRAWTISKERLSRLRASRRFLSGSTLAVSCGSRSEERRV